MIDVKQQINAVQRSLGRRELAAGTARVSTISRVYDTDLADLWEAVSSPERIPRWFLPVTGDLTVGSRYQLEGNAGGLVERCDAPRGYDATWEYGEEVSWIEVRLTEEGPDRTRFTLEHIAHVDDERWAQYGPGATGVGWDLGLIGLLLHLSSGGGVVDPKEVEAWTMSAEGRVFITLSSDLWCEQNIADGHDETGARAAAMRTTAFYTGVAAE
jgi:uncharacterized protein YndB with AHSA1/START domain